MSVMPALHTRVKVTERIPLPTGLPRDGWCVIGHNTDRGMVTVARNGQRVEVYASEITWETEK